MIKTEVNKVKCKSQRIHKREWMIKGVPLVITDHSLLKSAGKILQNRIYFLYMDNEVKKVF